MIQNKQELRQVAKDWMKQAKADLREKMVEFINHSGMSAAELANLLDVAENEVTAILNGNGDIRLSTFAKILIATDHVIAIQPVQMAMPMMGQRPMRGGFPTPRGGQFPPMGQMMGQRPMPRNCNCNSTRPNTPPMGGRFTQQNNSRPMPQDAPMNEENFMDGCFSLDELDRKDLIDIIVQNGWNNDIDLHNSTRSTLIDFIESREASMAMPPMDEENEMVNESDETRAMADWLAQELERNPHLKDTVRKYMR